MGAYLSNDANFEGVHSLKIASGIIAESKIILGSEI